MKRSITKMVEEFRTFWKNYVFQSLLATLIIFIVLLSLNIRDDAAIIASIGATTFIVFATPRAVPAAGGCSVSVTTIMKIARPTARAYVNEYIKTGFRNDGWGIEEHKNPQTRPTRWPPMMFLGPAVMLFGIANTIKVVAPIDAIIAASSRMFKDKSTINIIKVAKRLWKT